VRPEWFLTRCISARHPVDIWRHPFFWQPDPCKIFFEVSCARIDRQQTTMKILIIFHGLAFVLGRQEGPVLQKPYSRALRVHGGNVDDVVTAQPPDTASEPASTTAESVSSSFVTSASFSPISRLHLIGFEIISCNTRCTGGG
jgi:hypothetical protein